MNQSINHQSINQSNLQHLLSLQYVNTRYMFKRTLYLSNASVLSAGKQTLAYTGVYCAMCVSRSLITLCVTSGHRSPLTRHRRRRVILYSVQCTA